MREGEVYTLRKEEGESADETGAKGGRYCT